MNKVLVTGITGQVGSYMAEKLIARGDEVHGFVRRNHQGYGNLDNIIHLVRDESVYRSKLFLHAGDLSDATSIYRVIGEVKPDWIMNAGANADVMESFLMPQQTMDVNATAVFTILEAIRQIKPDIRLLQCSTSELFGAAEETPQNERTRMMPQSPYAISKLAAYHAVRKAVDSYDTFACNSIAFNHESPRRGEDFLTRKVTKAVARIKLGKQKELRLGNLEAKRDWSYAPEIVDAQIMMLEKPIADDYVLGTGETHTVQEWVEAAFNHAGLEWQKYVVIDKRLFRPAEVDVLQADPTRAKTALGWTATTRFAELVKIMVDADVKRESV